MNFQPTETDTIEADAATEDAGGRAPDASHVLRRADLDDVPALIEMAADFIANGDYWGERRTFAPVDFAHHLIALIRSPVAGFFVAEDDTGELAGTIAHVITHDIFSGGVRALKLHWFVKPEYAGLGLRLERHARQWAADQGATGLTMSAVNDDAAALLTRLGYQRTEALYHKVI